MRIDETTSSGIRVFPQVGERVPVIGSYSEVQMHMGTAGRPIEVSLEYQGRYENGQWLPIPKWGVVAQIWRDGRECGHSVTTGEGGFYDAGSMAQEGEPGYYTYMRLPDDQGDSDPRQVQRDITDMISEAMSGPGTMVITNLGLNF